MTQFSIGGAWSKGIGFFSNEAAGHAAILIGLGIVVPAILQFLLFGGPAGMANPAMMSQNVFATMAYAGAALLVATLVNYVLQTGSYFASWRLGLGRDGNVAGAILYGLIAAAGVVAIFMGLVVVGGLIISGALSGGSPIATIVLLLLLLVPLTVLFAALMALMCVAMTLLLLLVIAFGSMAGTTDPALAMAGGNPALLIVLALLLLLLWLTARLSCTGAAMADRGGFNLFGAMARSWRLTGDGQWRIMAYLALLGVLLCVVVFIFALVVGASMMSGLRAGGLPALGTGGMIVTFLVSIPFAYLVVLVPAGIYRELYEDSPAAVFT